MYKEGKRNYIICYAVKKLKNILYNFSVISFCLKNGAISVTLLYILNHKQRKQLIKQRMNRRTLTYDFRDTAAIIVSF